MRVRRHCPWSVSPVMLCCSLAVLAADTRAAAGQEEPKSIVPGPTFRVIRGEFTEVTAARPLPDGSVLLLDTGGNVVWFVPPEAGRAQPVSRVGSGPGEYRTVTRLLALSGDSTLLVDGGAGRWLLFSGGRVVSTSAADDAAVRAVRTPIGADRLGRVLGARQIIKDDSLALEIVSRRDGSVRQVARLAPHRLVTEVATRRPDGTPATHRTYPQLLGAPEQAALFADGWVAVARQAPFRIDWIDVEGRISRGEPVEAAAPATRQERERVAAELRDATRGMFRVDVDADALWAASVAPFPSSDALLPASNTVVAVRRQQRAGLPEGTLDFFDRRGRRIGRLSLPADERVVGFGAGTVVVGTVDPDGEPVVHIRRLRLP